MDKCFTTPLHQSGHQDNILIMCMGFIVLSALLSGDPLSGDLWPMWWSLLLWSLLITCREFYNNCCYVYLLFDFNRVPSGPWNTWKCLNFIIYFQGPWIYLNFSDGLECLQFLPSFNYCLNVLELRISIFAHLIPWKHATTRTLQKEY